MTRFEDISSLSEEEKNPVLVADTDTDRLSRNLIALARWPTLDHGASVTLSYMRNLVAEGADVHYTDEYGYTAFHAALHPEVGREIVRQMLIWWFNRPVGPELLILATRTNRLDLVDLLFLYHAHPTCRGGDAWPLVDLITRRLDRCGHVDRNNPWGVVDWCIFLRYLEAGQAEMLEHISVRLVAMLFSQVVGACRRRKKLQPLMARFAQVFVGGPATLLRLTEHPAYVAIWQRDTDVARVLAVREVLMRIPTDRAKVPHGKDRLLRKPCTGSADSKREAVLNLDF